MAKLYFYYSAMNAGKTTTLLQANYNYHERGMETSLFTPIIDNREAVGIIASRIGLKSKAQSFDDKFNFYKYFEEMEQEKRPNCILVDEAQFLTKNQVIELSDIADYLNIPVLAYGLRTDFKGELFEGSKYLLGYAESMYEIKTLCHCGSKAIMNGRVDDNGAAVIDGAQIEIGGNERYVSLCRRHFKDAIKSAKTKSEKNKIKAAC